MGQNVESAVAPPQPVARSVEVPALASDAPGDLLERDAELEALRQLAAEVRAGSGGLVVVEGPGGIGKTSLVDAFLAHARGVGLHVGHVTAAELERDLPWTVVRGLYDSVAGGTDLDPGAVDRLLDQELGVTPEPPRVGSALVRLRRGVLAFAAERPLLFVVDDAHWADPTSLRALHYLCRRVGGQPVGVVLARRTSEASPELDQLAALAGERRLLLHPVSPASTEALLRRRLADEVAPELVAAAHDVTSGNPLLVHELVRELRGGGHAADASAVRRLGPRTVARSALTRIDRLGPHAAAVAHAVAVLGADATTARVAALADLPEPAAADEVVALGAAELLADGPRPRFEHPLIATALYQHMPSGRRAWLHARAAEVLDADGVAADQVAAHLLLSEPSGQPWVIDRLRRAARRALTVGGSAHAVRLLERALEEGPSGPERGRVLLELGQVEAWELLPAAADHLDEARRRHPEAAGRVAATVALVRLLVMAQRWRSGLEVVEAALAGPDVAAVPGAADELRGERMCIRTSAGVDLDAHAAEVARLLGSGAATIHARLAAVHSLALGCGRGEEPNVVLARARWAWGMGELLEHRHALESLHWSHLVWHLALLGDHELAMQVVERAWLVARERGSRGAFAQAEVCRSWVHLHAGRVRGLPERLSAVRDGMDWRHGVGPMTVDAALSLALARGGDPGAALEVLDGRPPAEPHDDAYAGVLELARAEVLLLADRPAESERSAARVGALCAARGLDGPVDWPWRSLRVRALAVLGRRDEALALAAEDVARAEPSRHPRGLGLALLAQAQAAPAAERLPLAERAAALLAATPFRLEAVEAAVVVAAALRRAGRSAEARSEALAALAEADALGLVVLAHRARREAQLAGARPRRPALLGPESLTDAEREVARLAASGLTNREVAARLFVSPKTVEKHLAAAFRKLGVEHRSGLAGALGAS